MIAGIKGCPARRGLVVATVLVMSSVLGLGCGGSSPVSAQGASRALPSNRDLNAAVSSVARLDRTVLESYIRRSGRGDTRYWQGGEFIATDGPPCWTCYDAAATAAAVLSEWGRGDPRLRQIAIETFNHALRTRQAPSGEFRTDGVESGFFTVELEVSYLVLERFLPAPVKEQWLTSIRRAADWLARSGNLTFYVNGNVNLRQTEIMWLAWQITHNPRYRADYEEEWQFTISPPSHFPGFGLKVTQHASRPDGSDGSAYLAESGGGPPGFDPNYTMAQLDTATEMYVLSRSRRFLWLTNLLLNQELPLVHGGTTLDATNGTRKHYQTPFTSAAPAVLVLTKSRPDLSSLWMRELQGLKAAYGAWMKYTQVNAYKGLSGWLSLPLLAIEMRGMPGR